MVGGLQGRAHDEGREEQRRAPIITALGGVCCRPIAVRRNESTTTIRMNDVAMIRIDGARLRTVTSRTSRMI